jgi:diadenylate cyclase
LILGFNIGFLEISWVDIIDILMVSVLLYQVYKLMRGSVAIKVFLGFLFLYLIFLVVKAANMELLSIILGQFMGVGVIAVIILFQQEIRKFLLLIGKTTIFDDGNLFQNIKMLWKDKFDQTSMNITPIIEAIKTLGGSNTGALIVFSRDSELKFYADSGDRMDAIVSKRLLLAIFNKHSPLHDGAVIVNENRIVAARCILPVSEQDNLPAQFGLRHRAAVGMTENTDSLVIIVSEETGQLSTVRSGVMEHNLSAQEIRKKINIYLYNQEKAEDQEKASGKSALLEKVKAQEKKEKKAKTEKV